MIGHTRSDWRGTLADNAELRRGVGVHLIVLLAAGVVIAGVGVAAALLDVPRAVLTTEPQITLDGATYTGAFANVRALAWMVGVVLALVGWSMSTHRAERRMFLAGALLGAALLADDFFLVHDWLEANGLLPKRAIIVGYAIALALLLAAWWRTIGLLGVAGLTVAAALLAVSAVLDAIIDGFDELVGDGLKFLGICTWSTVWTLRAAPWRCRAR